MTDKNELIKVGAYTTVLCSEYPKLAYHGYIYTQSFYFIFYISNLKSLFEKIITLPLNCLVHTKLKRFKIYTPEPNGLKCNYRWRNALTK